MDDWNEKLLEAAKKGSVEELKLCLENGANIDYKKEYGYTALMLAAMYGHVEVSRLLLENKCNKDITSVNGETALMLAAWWGHVEVSRLLLENKCNKDITDEYGRTALMWAAMYGHVEVSRLLLENKCNKDITLRDGKTALHLAAEYGELHVTRYLVEEGGISPFVKTHEGKTPYDLAATGLYGPNKEVMEYLQTVMSEKSSGVTAGLGIEDEVPTEIKLMTNKRSVELYLKLLESGSEKKRDIRLVVVGKKGAGKTSLIKRLFGEDDTDVTSTNGIEIHKIKCKAKSDDGIWNKLDGNHEETEPQARLLKEYEGKLQDKGTVKKPIKPHIAINDNTPSTSFDETKKSRTVYQLPEIMKSQKSADPQLTNQHPDQSLEQAGRDYEAMQTAKSKVDLNDKEEYATLLLWDFAGDEEFYHTHQTFLSPDAIYLVVTKLNEADDPKAQDLFRLWIDSIHCYCRLEQNKNEADDSKFPNCIDPPVVVIGTWKDAVTCKIEELEDACSENLWQYTENLSEDERRHIRSKYFISNKKDDNHVFLQIRQDILNLARSMRTWNTDYPLKFIQLEQRLQEKKKELPIISYQEIMHMSAATPKPLSVEELRLFLDFHHEIRALVYFKDLPDYIILDTQWLSDAFKCIVTAKKFRAANVRNQKSWEEFYHRGKLHKEVLEDIFENEENILNKHKDYILNVMEKFDIVICPNKSEGSGEKPCYYVPCLIKAEPMQDIYKMFKVPEDARNRSTWLCFKFKFLPPHLMHHLIATLCRKYDIAEVAVPKNKKRQIALFKDSAVFELQKTKLRKLLVSTCPNSIQIQVLEFGKGMEEGLYKDIADFVKLELENIILKRFKMSNVEFDTKWECGFTKSEFVEGCNDFSGEKITEYFCETCISPHKFIGEWSEEQNKALSDKYEKKPGQIGLVLIVNFMFHGGTTERKGSEVDCKNLTNFFKEGLKYQVECTTRDMTKLQIQEYFQEIARTYLTEKSKDYHSFICVIMSHGNEDGILTTNGLITVEEIKKPFKNKTGGKFNGKPKVFLIQACRGKEEQEKVVVSDCFETEIHTGHVEGYDEFPGTCGNRQRRNSVEMSVFLPGVVGKPSGLSEVFSTDAHSYNSEHVPTDADIIVAYATTPGYISIRNVYEGAFFIRAFLSVAKNKYNEEHIEEILRNVRNELATNPEYAPQSGSLAGKCQMGMLETTSTKKFFL